jgi:rSAM/selenodomain-associated transferase 1
MAKPDKGTRHEGRGTRKEGLASSLSSRATRLQAAEAALVIFAKAPIPGQVKTRLCPPLTPDEAASLHGSFVLDVLERSGHVAKKGEARYDRFLACAPSSEHVFFKIMEERHGVRLIDQIGEDLGIRMERAFSVIFAMEYRSVLLVGTDLPTLPDSSFAKALHLLTDHDLVFGPSRDGGYFLIGLNRSAPQLFLDIPWSTDQVLAQTRCKANTLGLKTALLPMEQDVDTIDDLKALIRESGLRAGPAAREKRQGGQVGRTIPLTVLSKRTEGALRLLIDRHKELWE